jgi:hypothetical protein
MPSAGRLRGTVGVGGSRLVAALVLGVQSLAAQGRPSAPPTQRPRGASRGTIAVGDTVRDSLAARDLVLSAEDTYAQEWRLNGRAGETVTIDLVSTAFDAYVFLLGPGLGTPPPQDDDSGGRCNARLTVRLPVTAPYRIVVTSSERRATGPFLLAVTAGRKAPALEPCTR